jgi:hypothetical protein
MRQYCSVTPVSTLLERKECSALLFLSGTPHRNKRHSVLWKCIILAIHCVIARLSKRQSGASKGVT